MADDQPGQDRTEAPTQRRLQQARETGQIPVSSELPVCAALLTGTISLISIAPSVTRQLTGQMALLLAHLDLNPIAALRHLAWATATATLPLVVLPLIASVLAFGLQTGFSVNPILLLPSLGRVSPAAGLARLFSAQNLIETGKAVLKLFAVGFATYYAIASSLPSLTLAPLQDPRALLSTLTGSVTRVCFVVLAIQVGITVLDVLWTRFSFLQSLRMSRQELKEEAKDTDGDPLIKSRLRRLRQQRARQRISSAVPKATVVITNPTEYAVALAYDRAHPGAPRVVAKGVDHLAAAIRAVAKDHGIPLVANPPLARALYRVDVDSEIPQQHYKAVAEIIAYIWRLRAKAAGTAQRAAL